jgi:purine-binding chemotaxis protein CheW
MSNPPDKEEDIQQSVQEYLDVLLTQATEKPEAQVNVDVVEPQRGQLQAKASPSNVTALPDLPSRYRPSVAQTMLPKVHLPKPQRLITASQAKPYADPVRPLTLKASLPKLKACIEGDSLPEAKAEPKPTESLTPITPPVSELTGSDSFKLEPSPLPIAEVLQQPELEISISEELSTEPVAEVEPVKVTQWLENGRPSWAQSRFECLLFNVGGLMLAVPLVELGTIYPLEADLTPIFGQVDWFMGLLTVKDGNLRTVDTAKLVMPERYDESMKEQFNYVISINEMDWGLAVDSVSTAIILEPDEVRWRSQRSKRPWLAGTVVEHMCALIDVSQLAVMLEAQT